VSSRFVRLALVPVLLAATAGTATGQYRRQVEELPPVFGASVSLGALFSWEETVTPIETPLPEGPDRRTIREVGTVPAISVQARYGRGLAVYGNATVGAGGSAELSGSDPLTAAPVSGEQDIGLVGIVSVGLSFVPVPDLMGLRLDLGPTWADLGDGGSYLGLRVAAAARFLEIGDRFGVVLAWDGHFLGGQDDQDRVEYQIRDGIVTGVRMGFELEL
jgi:hypothetical protein